MPETRQSISDLTELLAAIERAGVTGDPSAFTSRELRGATGYSERRCENIIRAGIQMGKLRAVRKAITDLAGRPQTVPAYAPVKQ